MEYRRDLFHLYKMEDPNIKIYFIYEIFILDVKLKNFKQKLLFPHVKWHVNFFARDMPFGESIGCYISSKSFD